MTYVYACCVGECGFVCMCVDLCVSIPLRRVGFVSVRVFVCFDVSMQWTAFVCALFYTPLILLHSCVCVFMFVCVCMCV